MSTLIVFLLCFVLSAFFAGAEMAFVSANKLKIRQLADSGDPAARLVLILYEHPQRFLTALLIGNNVVNVSATSIFTYEIQRFFGLTNEWLVLGVIAPLLLIFGETVPKDYCRIRSQSFLLSYSGVLTQMAHFFYFPVRMILGIVDFCLSPLSAHKKKNLFVSEEEFRSVIQESVKSGVISGPEKHLIDTILDFEKIAVRDVMTPVSRVPMISITSTVGAAKEAVRQMRSKMLLVYEEIPAIVVGMIYVFDLLFEADETQGLKIFLRSPVFVPHGTSIETAFLTLQNRHQSFAVITDSAKEVTGVVPIENLLVV